MTSLRAVVHQSQGVTAVSKGRHHAVRGVAWDGAQAIALDIRVADHQRQREVFHVLARRRWHGAYRGPP